MTTETNDLAARKAAIEDELRARLARDHAAPPTDPLAGVRLVCLACRTSSDADARFCTHCGARFNILVIAAAPPPAEGGGA